MSIFKVRADVIPVLGVLLLLALQLWACTLSPLWAFLVAWAMIYFVGTTAVLQHHHNHLPIFHNRWLNGLIDLVMGLQSGITAYGWVLHHNIGHHGNYLQQQPAPAEVEVDASTWTRADGSCMRRWEYVWYNRRRMHAECTRIGQRATKIHRLYRNYRHASWLITAVLLVAFGWSAFFAVVVLPQVMVLITFETTYGHHAGLHAEDDLEASRNITTGYYNRLRLNLGFHTAHHMKPGVHWSRLPALHAKLAGAIPEELNDAEVGVIDGVFKGFLFKKRAA